MHSHIHCKLMNYYAVLDDHLLQIWTPNLYCYMHLC